MRLANDGYWYYVRSRSAGVSQSQVQGRAEGWVVSNLARFEPSQNRYATLVGDMPPARFANAAIQLTCAQLLA